MRGLVLLGLLALALLLQGTVLGMLRIGGVMPDLVLMLVVFVAFLSGKTEGAFWGFVAGLIKDAAAGSYFGLNALSLMTAGYLVGLAERRLYKDSIPVAMFVTWLAAVVSQLAHYLLLLYWGMDIPPGTAMRVIFGVAFYTAVLVPLFYRRFYRSQLHGWLRNRQY
ncbi:rod shape-determining protein MreD [Desulfotomaculum copahuensis]|uniref:Rod shape-determining protein MreD n=1 Tax=Desulfotomaculum copahuensis TaxID=1838280 RepID=A0A1B7LHF9_9FIRM|nr:rod shape-determining protein MreD [Desulfotomaculum copahuensis]OAT85612.1 rod shape-determining protein MreD [Desulfotomaculum copahuensis]